MKETQEIPLYDALHREQLSLKERLQLDGTSVTESISILAPATLVYEFWRNPTNLPLFFTHLESVKVISDKVSHWVSKASKDQKIIEWDIQITEDVPGAAISWQTIGNVEVKHAGTVRFTELPYGRGTVVDVKMVSESPKQTLSADLKRLREIIETGEVPTTEGQSRGRLH